MNNDDLLAKTQDWYKKSKQECIDNPDGFYTTSGGWSVEQKEAIRDIIEHAIVRALNNLADETGYESDLVYESQVINDAANNVWRVLYPNKENK